MGPVIVTADEFPCPPALSIRSFVNGELRQNSVTDQVFFNIRHIVSELSQGMTLPAGTILITGTPAGVGMGMDPLLPQARRCGHLRDRRDRSHLQPHPLAFCFETIPVQSLQRGPGGFAIVLRGPAL